MTHSNHIRILLLADPGSTHTLRWARSLASRGLDICIFGLTPYSPEDYENTDIHVHSAGIKARGSLQKIKYLATVYELRKLIKEFKPDILHAHYATSYGMLGRLSGFKPFIISVWGTDIYEFPRRSPIHCLILKRNLAAATRVLSTSHVMAAETSNYFSNGTIEVTPFGVDLDFFRPTGTKERQAIRIGTVKTLSPKYGIDILIEAFAIVKARTKLPITLVIAGEGKERPRLENLATKLGVHESVKFLGKISHRMVPQVLNTFTIFCALSIEESFGVAAVEASACEIPVVVSDAAGLSEVVENGVTGIVVPKKDVRAAAGAIERLLHDAAMRDRMGKAGRVRVQERYEWKRNVDQLIKIYHDVLQKQ